MRLGKNENLIKQRRGMDSVDDHRAHSSSEPDRCVWGEEGDSSGSGLLRTASATPRRVPLYCGALRSRKSFFASTAFSCVTSDDGGHTAPQPLPHRTYLKGRSN